MPPSELDTSPPLPMEAAIELALGSKRPLHFLHARGCAAAALVHGLRQRSDRPVLVVVKDSQTVTQTLDDLNALGSGTLSVPAALLAKRRTLATAYDVSDGTPYDETLPDRRRELGRVAALYMFLSGRRDTLVVPAPALWRKCVPLEVLERHSIHLMPGQPLELEATARALVAAGYLRAPLVEEPGEFAVRGGLLDIWAAGERQPVRLDLDGDRVTALRSFDPDTQKSQIERRELVVPPAREVLRTPSVLARAQQLVQSLCDAIDMPTLKARTLLEHISEGRSFFGLEALLPAYYELVPLTKLLPPSTIVVLEDPSALVLALRKSYELAERAEAQVEERPKFPLGALFASESELMARLGGAATVLTHPGALLREDAEPASTLEALESAPASSPSLGTLDHLELQRAMSQARQSKGHQAGLAPLEHALNDWFELGLQITLTARTATQADRLSTLLSHRNIESQIAETGALSGGAGSNTVTIAVTPLARGMRMEADACVLLTEEEVFGKRRHQVRRARKPGSLPLDDLRSLQVDDFVVHVEHGIGRYKGLEHRQVGDIWLDLLVVEYQGGDKLFLPVYRLNQIQKHKSADGQAKLDRLGGQSFARTKAKVRRRIRDMADELLRLYAERMNVKRPPLPVPDDEYRTFEAAFPFEETPDQLGAIQDVLGDLQRDVVMDRLVCGDVGFGKTEVALRAAFLNVMQGRQVALLCPTTVLAQQHFLTFQTRFADYPVDVRVLSRFQSKKSTTQTLLDLKAGKVDIVVGTHRLLSKDVHFKNLGLLVVDEEQRFGVAHKERIKQLKQTVDVLTLSATPIPRTLQMAVSGIRDLSMIATPPVDRRGIRTLVSRVDDGVIRSSIERELGRGGQVFYVYNRVEGLTERAAHLRTLLANLRVGVAHGQQNERELERVMLSFIRGEFDVLCSTAIIENGLDIPRANTMIVDRADLMGLSQLYQLRGRVGRSHQQAYCYLMVPPPSRMTDVARARIDAMQRYTELGAGFQIANMDMDIRGAGDLLGAEQSGFVQTVGFELFCEMLHEATQELSGHQTIPDIDPELSVDVEALIPADYVEDVGVRLSIYKRLASAGAVSDVEAIASEVGDRFGSPPPEVRRLVALMTLKVELRSLRALGCEATKERVSLHLNQDTPLSAARIGSLVAQHPHRYSLTPTGRLGRRAASDEHFENGLDHASLVVAELQGHLDPVQSG